MRVLKGEEERFLETLTVGMRLYEDVKRDVVVKRGRVIPGDVVYRLYDTYGFPVDITEDMAREDGLAIDTAGFERALDEQKERSRSDWKAKKEGWTKEASEVLTADAGTCSPGTRPSNPKAPFSLRSRRHQVRRLRAGDEGDLFFDVTPFYGDAGGQVADEGVILGDGVAAAISPWSRASGKTSLPTT